MATQIIVRPESKRMDLLPRGKAFIVDENPHGLRHICSALEKCGYRVRACTSYMEAVRHLRSEDSDLVVTAQGSPNFEGRCVLVRAKEISERLPVLVVAPYADARCCREAMELGALGYLVVPIKVEELIRILGHHSEFRARAA
jgi:DNA-binding NtrC family response regulator